MDITLAHHLSVIDSETAATVFPRETVTGPCSKMVFAIPDGIEEPWGLTLAAVRDVFRFRRRQHLVSDRFSGDDAKLPAPGYIPTPIDVASLLHATS